MSSYGSMAGSGTSTNTSATPSGGGLVGSGTSGSNTSTSIGTGATAFRYYKDLADQTIYLTRTASQVNGMGFTFDTVSGEFDVQTTGYIGDPTVKWFKDNQEITTNHPFLFPAGNSLHISGYDYTVDGYYRVETTDRENRTIKSRTAHIIVADEAGACSAGVYNASNRDDINATAKAESRFKNIRGNWLISEGIAAKSVLSGLSFNKARIDQISLAGGNFNNQMTIGCTSYLSNIHESNYTAASPVCPIIAYSSLNVPITTCNAPGVWSGGITLECRNQRWLMIKNTCQFTIQLPIGSSTTPPITR